MIDLHVHILPGLDDGAKNVEEALAMAQRACDDGISAVVATPHVITGLYSNTREVILSAVEHLRGLLQDNEIPLKIFPGAEYHLEPELPERLARGELLTINDTGRYLLVELPAALIPGHTGRVIYELLLQGVVPVIVHPERNAGFVREPSLLYDLISKGALAQVTADSLTGRFGSKAAVTARVLVEHGCAHFIASDAHSPRSRAPALRAAVQEASRLIGENNAQELVIKNPQHTLKGESIPTISLKEIHPSKTGFLKRLFS